MTYSKWTRSPRKVSPTPNRKSWLILYHIVWNVWKCCVQRDPAVLVDSYPLVLYFAADSEVSSCCEGVSWLLFCNVPLVQRTRLDVGRWVDRLVMCFKHLFCCHNHTLYCNNILLKFTKALESLYDLLRKPEWTSVLLVKI